METKPPNSAPFVPTTGDLVNAPPVPGERNAGLPLPTSGVDSTGRALPITDDEWAARMQWLTDRLAEIDAADDTPDEVYEQFMKNLDEERRRVGRPPAFEGYY